MAKKKTTRKVAQPKLVEIQRHIAGPPRRSPGQRLLLAPTQIREQGLKHTDFKVIKRSG